jgi:uncharacterized repeat protein (TIGR03806 family)
MPPANDPTPKKLSEYGFFIGEMKELKPRADVLPYELNSALFTDYAHKARFVYVPPGKAAVFNPDETFDFPVGSVLIKNFFYYRDERQPSLGREIIETRLLVRQDTGWRSLTYRWNSEQTDAILWRVGELRHVSWTDAAGQTQTVLYAIPNENECYGCHSVNHRTMPIGPRARHLNRAFDYPDGRRHQLTKWTEKGILTGAPSDPTLMLRLASYTDTTQDLEERARAYLEINCAHCHNPRGPANNSGLNLNYDETSPTAYGVCKPPVAAGRGSGGLKYSIVPGKPEESILVHRMKIDDPGSKMPELGRDKVHREGVALIEEWIRNMPGHCGN